VWGVTWGEEWWSGVVGWGGSAHSAGARGARSAQPSSVQ
jgi:hypothetical protein